MLSEPQPSTFDPEFEAPFPAEAQRPGSAQRDKKRLLVNPILALVDWLVAVALLRAAITRVNFALFAAGAWLLFLGFVLAQYHCLDCGATGWLVHQGRHVCREDRLGRPSRRRRVWRVPGISVQIVVWFYLLAAAVILLLIVARS